MTTDTAAASTTAPEAGARGAPVTTDTAAASNTAAAAKENRPTAPAPTPTLNLDTLQFTAYSGPVNDGKVLEHQQQPKELDPHLKWLMEDVEWLFGWWRHQGKPAALTAEELRLVGRSLVDFYHYKDPDKCWIVSRARTRALQCSRISQLTSSPALPCSPRRSTTRSLRTRCSPTRRKTSANRTRNTPF